ncbi:phage antirepressor KilAC domain-containing protein [Acetobacter okinawensis]|uniref:phage antirepressor KilAC domain-containing protein n=1 Tax=Acetobacter okinawensis TaxID=1076594 RepID=UPI000688636B|nr:phage regulatory protein/antirepressor Ant [Acetobacter okinawensis]
MTTNTINAVVYSTPTMSSREIAELTGKKHFHVVRDIKAMLKAVNLDEAGYIQTWIDPQNGQEYEEYNLPKNLTLNLVTGYRADMRLKIIDRWLELEAKPAVAAPSNMVEALTLALEQQKELQAKDAEIAELSPKAAALDVISEAEGDMGVRDAGRELGIGMSKVVDFLLDHKWACREGEKKKKLRPAHYGQTQGYCRLVTKTYPERYTGETCVGHDFKITPRGLARLAVLLCGINSEPARRLNGAKKAAPVPFFQTPA